MSRAEILEFEGRCMAFDWLLRAATLCDGPGGDVAAAILDRAALHVSFVSVPCWSRFSMSSVPFEGVRV